MLKMAFGDPKDWKVEQYDAARIFFLLFVWILVFVSQLAYKAAFPGGT